MHACKLCCGSGCRLECMLSHTDGSGIGCNHMPVSTMLLVQGREKINCYCWHCFPLQRAGRMTHVTLPNACSDASQQCPVWSSSGAWLPGFVASLLFSHVATSMRLCIGDLCNTSLRPFTGKQFRFLCAAAHKMSKVLPQVGIFGGST